MIPYEKLWIKFCHSSLGVRQNWISKFVKHIVYLYLAKYRLAICKRLIEARYKCENKLNAE